MIFPSLEAPFALAPGAEAARSGGASAQNATSVAAAAADAAGSEEKIRQTSPVGARAEGFSVAKMVLKPDSLMYKDE